MVPHAFVSQALMLLVLRLGVGVSLAGTTAALGVQVRLVVADGKEGAAYGAASTAQSLGWGLGPMLGAALQLSWGYRRCTWWRQPLLEL